MRTRVIAALIALTGWVTAMPARQTPTFSAQVDAIRVDVLVTEAGRPVPGLQPEDFEVFDNGVPQRVDIVSSEEVPLNVVMALDTSASMEGEGLEHLRAAGGALLDGLRPDDQAALITFGHAVVVRARPTRELPRVRAFLAQARARGTTALLDAAYAAIVLGESAAGRPLVIVFSDGVDTASWLSEEAVRETARRSDAVIYGVAVRGGGSFLRALAEATGGELFEAESTSDLRASFVTILEQFRQRYLVSYTPSGVSPGGWHALEVRVKPRGAQRVTVRARPGYLAGR